MIDAKEKRKAARILRVTACGHELRLARRGILRDGDGADDAAHRNRARVEKRKIARINLCCEEHIRVDM